MKHPTPTVIALIAVNAVFFVATYMVPNMEQRMLELFALHSPQDEGFRLWQFVSHVFMHGNLGHLFLNMFGLFVFGGPLERLWGAQRFLVFYFLAGIGAGLIHTGIHIHESGGLLLGASGAIYGILVAFALLFPNVKLFLLFLPVPIAAKIFVPILLLIDLFSGVTGISLFGGGIAHFAHIGGALIGFLLMLYWRKKLPERP